MPLTLSPAQQSAAQILNQLRKLQSDYHQPMITMDTIVNGIIALPSDQLADLGNEIGPVELQSLLDAHAAQVAGVNALAAGVEQIIASIESRQPAETRTASTATLYERLATQGREIVLTDGLFAVQEISENE